MPHVACGACFDFVAAPLPLIADVHFPLQEDSIRNGGPQAPRKRFDALLALGDLKGAWEAAVDLKSRDAWGALCDAALNAMDIDLAIWVFRFQQAASMVLSLERIRHIEDKNLLAGHVLVLKDSDYNTAQELFLRSSYPKARRIPSLPSHLSVPKTKPHLFSHTFFLHLRVSNVFLT